MCFLAFFMLFSFALKSEAEQVKEVFTLPNPILEGVAERKIRVVHAAEHKGDMFISLSNSELYRWEAEKMPELYTTLPFAQNPSPADKTKMPEEKAAASSGYLLSNGDDLMVFYPSSGMLGKVTEKDVAWYPEAIDMHALHSQEGKIADISVFQHNKTIYIVSVSSASSHLQYILSEFSPNAPLLKTTDIEGAFSLCYDGSRLLLLDADNDGHLRLKGMDLQSKEIETINIGFPDIPKDDPIGGFCADAATKQICFFSRGQVYVSKDMKPFEAVATLPFPSMPPWSLAWIVRGEQYAALSGGLYMRSLSPEQNAGRKLNVAGATSFGEPIAFRKRYPDVELQYQPMLVSAQDAYMQMLSKDSTMDIFNVQVNKGYRKLIEKGFVTPLDSSASIREDISSMYPQVQRVLVNDKGEAIAWPTEFFIDRPQISTNLWKLVYNDRPLPNTFAELLDAMLLWEESLANDWPDIDFVMNFDHAYLAQYFVDAYVQSQEAKGKEADFSAPVLQDMLRSLEKIRDLRQKRGANIAFLSPEVFEPKPFIFDSGLYSAAFDDTKKTFFESQEDFVYGVNPNITTNVALKITQEDEPYYRGRMMVWLVNPYSKNIDLAIDFIQMSAGVDNATMLYYALHPGADTPYPDKDFDEKLRQAKERQTALQERIKDAEGAELRNLQDRLNYFNKWLANLDNEKWMISAEQIESHQKAAPLMNFFENSALLYAREYSVDGSYAALYQRYAQGQLTLEQLLDNLRSIIHLITSEQ